MNPDLRRVLSATAGRLLLAPEALATTLAVRARSRPIDVGGHRVAGAVLGMQVLQAEHHRHRGLHRYALAHAQALERAGAVQAVDFAEGVPRPQLPLQLSARTPARGAATAAAHAGLYHVMSLFEHAQLDAIWPPWARQPKFALVVTVYDLIPWLDPARYLAGVRAPVRYANRVRLLRACDAVLAISQATAAALVDVAGVDPARIHEIGAGAWMAPHVNGVEPPALPALPREGYLLHVGGLDSRKNAGRLLEAYAELPAAIRSEHQLVLVGSYGDAELASLRPLLARLGPDCMLLGAVDDRALAALYRRCRLTVSASLLEGYGLPLLEAMASGAAVVASDIPAHRELVASSEALFDPTNVVAIRAALERALTDMAFNAKLRELGAAAAIERTWDRVAERTIAAYAAACRRRALDASAFERA